MKHDFEGCNHLTLLLLRLLLVLNGVEVAQRYTFLFRGESLCGESLCGGSKMSEHLPPRPFKVVIAGATGATGRHLFSYLIKTKEFGEIVHLGRRKVTDVEGVNITEEESTGRIKQHVIDMENLSSESIGEHFQGADIYMSCLGTTRRQAGSAVAFKHVDLGYNLKLASIAKEQDVKIFSLMSTQGADKGSWFLYLNVKGELEEECKTLKFPTLTIFRPGFLDRGGSSRLAEKVVAWFVDRISIETVARAMCSNALLQLSNEVTTPKSQTEFIYYNNHIRHMSETFDLA